MEAAAGGHDIGVSALRGGDMSEFGTPVNWRKSSFSQNGDCTEVACNEITVLVRDSKGRPGTVLKFGYLEWKLFVAETKSAESALSD
jgi:hypothetical protein